MCYTSNTLLYKSNYPYNILLAIIKLYSIHYSIISTLIMYWLYLILGNYQSYGFLRLLPNDRFCILYFKDLLNYHCIDKIVRIDFRGSNKIHENCKVYYPQHFLLYGTA